MADGFRLRTPRTLIRSVSGADLPALYAIATLPAVARMLFLFRPGMPREDFGAIFPLGAGAPPFRTAIEHRGQVVGSIGVGAGSTPPIYYFLAPKVAGQGLATEIVAAFCDHITRRHAPEALTAEVFTDNPASRRVLEKCGFRLTGETPLTSAARTAPAAAWQFRRP